MPKLTKKKKKYLKFWMSRAKGLEKILGKEFKVTGFDPGFQLIKYYNSNLYGFTCRSAGEITTEIVEAILDYCKIPYIK